MKTGQNYHDTSASGYMYYCLIILMLHVKKHWAMIYHQQLNYPKCKKSGDAKPLGSQQLPEGLGEVLAMYRIAGIYYKSFNFANRKALAKIKASIYFWINIVQTKCIASN